MPFSTIHINCCFYNNSKSKHQINCTENEVVEHEEAASTINQLINFSYE